LTVLERRLDIEGRELLRQLLQDHVDLPLTAIKGTSVKPSFVKS